MKKGTRVQISLSRYEQYTGTVISASNYGTDAEPNWYIEFNHDKPVPGFGGTYGYWKQGIDGGTVEILPG